MKLGNIHKQHPLYPKLMLILIIFLTIINPFSTDMYLPSLSDIVFYFQTTEAALNVTIYGFLLAEAIAMLFMGPLSDKYGRKKLLIGSSIIFIISSLLCSVAPTIELFILLRIIQGTSAGGIMVISVALVKDCFEEKKQNKIITLVSILMVIGPLLAPFLGTVIINTINWQFTIVFPSLLIIIALIITLILPEPLPKENRFTGNILGVITHIMKICRNRSLTLFLIAMAMPFLPYMTFLAISSYIYIDDFGFSKSEYSLLLGINLIIGVIGMIVLQKIGKKYGLKKEGGIILLFILISSILILIFGTINPLIFIICYLPCAIASITRQSYSLHILMQESKTDAGSISALFNFTLMFVGCIGMLLGTLPWSSYITGLGICMLGAALIGILLWILLIITGMNLKGLKNQTS